MKVNIAILAAIILAAVLIFSLGVLTKFKAINEPLNKIVAGTPDKSCSSDADCAMKQIDCEFCLYMSEGAAVNKNYKPFCPLRFFENIYVCPQALPRWVSNATICEAGICKTRSA